MRVAIVHEWFSVYAGSERVVEQLLSLYPQADLFALVDVLPQSERGFLGGRPVRTSFIQSLPFARTNFRSYLPLMPLAVEQFDLTGYDLILSSNHAVAKGVVRAPGQLHVSYIHTPIRYAWDLHHQYLREAGLAKGPKSWIARAILHYIRNWDRAAADRVDLMVANSRYISQRIWASYRRKSTVVYPPVDVDAFCMQHHKEDFYLAASRMVPYKRMNFIVEAFAHMPDKELVVIGDGPELARVKAKAGPNVRVLGYQPFEAMRDYMRNAKAFIFAAEEDFGITPVEAMACGTPVIAYGKGGALETVVDGETGLFFREHTPEHLIEAIRSFEHSDFDVRRIRLRAERFRPERFRSQMTELVREQFALSQFKAYDEPQDGSMGSETSESELPWMVA